MAAHLNPKSVTTAGIRSLAVFEAAKGLLVLAAGFGLLRLVHRDVRHAAESMVRHLHLSTKIGDSFIRVAGRFGDTQLVLAALFAFVYASVRLAEAYGLWRMRPWAEWLAIASAGLYLPVEVYELLHHPTKMRAFVLATNVMIVIGLSYVRLAEHRAAAHSRRRPA
jgi:uncharacterized membrane protein (DUF2068 family)